MHRTILRLGLVAWTLSSVFLAAELAAVQSDNAGTFAVVGGHILKGRVPGAGDALLVSNDYLSISRHPEIVSAQADSLQEVGRPVASLWPSPVGPRNWGQVLVAWRGPVVRMRAGARRRRNMGRRGNLEFRI